MAPYRYVKNSCGWTLGIVAVISFICISNAAFLLVPDPCPKSYYQFVIKSDKFVTCCPCQSCSNETPTQPLERRSKCSKDDLSKSCVQFAEDQCCKLSECCGTVCENATRCKVKSKNGDFCECKSRINADGIRKRCRRKNDKIEVSAPTSLPIPKVFTNTTKTRSYLSVPIQLISGKTAAEERNASTVIPDVSRFTAIHLRTSHTHPQQNNQPSSSTSLRIRINPTLIVGYSFIGFALLVVVIAFIVFYKKKSNQKTNFMRSQKSPKHDNRGDSSITLAIISDSSNNGSQELIGGHTEKQQLLNTSGAFSDGRQEKGRYEEGPALLNNDRPSTTSSNSENSSTEPSEVPRQQTINITGGSYYALSNANDVHIHNHHYPNTTTQTQPPSAPPHYSRGGFDVNNNGQRSTDAPQPTPMSNYNTSYNSDVPCVSATATGYNSTLSSAARESASVPSHPVQTRDQDHVRSNPTYPIRQHTTDQLATNQSQHRSRHFQSGSARSNTSSLNVCLSKSTD